MKLDVQGLRGRRILDVDGDVYHPFVLTAKVRVERNSKESQITVLGPISHRRHVDTIFIKECMHKVNNKPF